MKSCEISRSKIALFSLPCTDPYIGIGWEYQSRLLAHHLNAITCVSILLKRKYREKLHRENTTVN